MDMVEKVARAIAQEYSGIPNYDWTAFEGEARVAIAAMREPTEEMLAAAFEDAPKNMDDMLHGDFAEAYTRAIDAALKPLPPDRR